MTNNIEKLYELAKVGQKPSCESSYFHNCGKRNCNICDKARYKKYPPFTDIKQLELIKWIQIHKNKQYLHFVDVVSSYFRGLKFETKEEEKKFIDSEYPQKLAKFVCELWNYLTDMQKEELKRILE